jgi:hypothetical protein
MASARVRHQRREAEEHRRQDDRTRHHAHEPREARLARAREDHEAGRAEADGLRRDEGQEQPEQLAGEDGGPGDRLRVEQLGGAPVRRQLEDAEHERRERHEQQDELDERDRRAREVLDAAAAREDVAGRRDEQGEAREYRGEDLEPARADGERQLLFRAQPQRGRELLRRGREAPVPGTLTHVLRPHRGGPSGPNTSCTPTCVPRCAPGSASREAALACAIRPESIGVLYPTIFV